jgi:hypothetical protein
MLPLEFADEGVRWNPDNVCIELGAVVGEYRGRVRVPALVFRQLLAQPVLPEKRCEVFHLVRTQFEQAVAAKILRGELSDDGNIDLVHRDLFVDRVTMRESSST